ncbi:MAG: IS1634 family transposase [Anaerolineales bacterium]|nr:IS1634 family transposase [Anaerolineales bacterium]
MAEVAVQTERVDDIPLLVKQQQEMGIAEIIDEEVSRHGNRGGLSLGWMTIGWLAYILSESDHRVSYVEAWAREHLQTLNGVIPGSVIAKDFTDDRLGDALGELSDDGLWGRIEAKLDERVVRVYALPRETVRVDTTTVSVYHDSEGSALLAYGHSKDHRPDLAQLKVLLATLDPLALPIVTRVVAGNRADDGLYLPAIQATQKSLSANGLLYVGDSKMEALETRAHLAHSGDYYLVPLSQKGDQQELLAEQVAYVLTAKPDLVSVYSSQEEAEQEVLRARGWKSVRTQEAVIADEFIEWREQLLLIYSPALAHSGERGLAERLQSAQEKLARLTPAPGRGKRQYDELEPLQDEVAKILNQHCVTDFLQVTYHKQVEERNVRGYKDKPPRTQTTVRYQLAVTQNQAAIQAAQRTMGWRLCATNAPPERLSLEDAVRTYRGSVPTIERLFSRLKGRPLGLRPVFVHREHHLKGLIRLLSLALCILTLIEFVVQRSLQAEQESLAGLFPGNPTKQTNRPTTERLLQAFKGIHLSIIDLPDQHIRQVTPLTDLQNRILFLLRFSPTIYADLALLPPIPP